MTANVLIDQVRSSFEKLPDARKGGNHQRYKLQDAALSAFAVFFTQSPSFLDYQVRMQKQRGRNNASSLVCCASDPQRPANPQLAAPEQAAVFPLPPAFVVPQDGHDKQDCEMAASARWLAQWAPRVTQWGATTFLGDDLYCHQPFCQQVRAQGCHFLFTCLPASHATLYEWVGDLARSGALGTVVQTRWTGRQRLSETYRFAGDLPLRGSEDALLVDWCELTTTDASGKVLYRNAWATSHKITADHVIDVARAGRSRWKIENENNTLKTRGYHFEHNYGHGKQHLASLLASLMILAYLMHTVLDLLDQRSQAVRARLPSRTTFFEHLRALAQ
ncbi:MAG: transposase, partial [Polaromonas sp.]